MKANTERGQSVLHDWMSLCEASGCELIHIAGKDWELLAERITAALDAKDLECDRETQDAYSRGLMDGQRSGNS